VNGRKFPGHRIILAARSSVFAKILFIKNAPREIDCTEVSEVGFDILLRFIYTDELGTTDQKEIIEAHQAARLFDQKELLQKCEALFGQWDITCDNVCTILNTATDILFLKERCLEYIKNNNEAVLNSNDFLKASSNSLLDMFEYACFNNIPAFVPLINVLRWGADQFPKLEDYTMIRKHLELTKILGRLRIQELSNEELVKVIAEYRNFLTPLEFQQFTLHNLPIPGEKNLPEWCIL